MAGSGWDGKWRPFRNEPRNTETPLGGSKADRYLQKSTQQDKWNYELGVSRAKHVDQSQLHLASVQSHRNCPFFKETFHDLQEGSQARPWPRVTRCLVSSNAPSREKHKAFIKSKELHDPYGKRLVEAGCDATGRGSPRFPVSLCSNLCSWPHQPAWCWTSLSVRKLFLRVKLTFPTTPRTITRRGKHLTRKNAFCKVKISHRL